MLMGGVQSGLLKILCDIPLAILVRLAYSNLAIGHSTCDEQSAV